MNTTRERGRYASKRPWTPEEDNRLALYYRRKGDGRRLSLELGRTIGAIHDRARKLGYAQHVSRTWTEKEDAFLEAHADRPAHWIGRHLKRTATSVKKRRAALGFISQAREGWYTLEDVQAITGLSQKVLERYLASGDLKGSQRQYRSPWCIEADDLKRFIRRHVAEIKRPDLVGLLSLFGVL